MVALAHVLTFARTRLDCKLVLRAHSDARREQPDARRRHRGTLRERFDVLHESRTARRPGWNPRDPDFLGFGGEPIAMKPERHPLRQGDPGHGAPGRFLGVQDNQVRGVAVLVVGVEKQPTLVLTGRCAVGHENGFARDTSVRGIPEFLSAFLEIVFQDRGRRMLLGGQGVRAGGIAKAIGQAGDCLLYTSDATDE